MRYILGLAILIAGFVTRADQQQFDLFTYQPYCADDLRNISWRGALVELSAKDEAAVYGNISATSSSLLLTAETKKKLAAADFRTKFDPQGFVIFEKFGITTKIPLDEPIISIRFFPTFTDQGWLAIVGWTQVRYFHFFEGELKAKTVADFHKSFPKIDLPPKDLSGRFTPTLITDVYTTAANAIAHLKDPDFSAFYPPLVQEAFRLAFRPDNDSRFRAHFYDIVGRLSNGNLKGMDLKNTLRTEEGEPVFRFSMQDGRQYFVAYSFWSAAPLRVIPVR